MRTPSWESFIFVSLPLGFFCTLCFLAVERWGVIAFPVILIPVLILSLGSLRMGWFGAYTGYVRSILPNWIGLLAGSMASAPDLTFRQEMLVALPVGLAAGSATWFVTNRLLPRRACPARG